ncbi:hypothetical protein DSO57_1032363 [Entomophthora muscae]|uniref:Uncharacterized protein n=1 Tax=Entomophthora muscae TaxID=34485 RepID=A0ACC2U9G6_9FUNG|nr:hypothetical protein DSO57_1032363 [Entomophthora muscae]
MILEELALEASNATLISPRSLSLEQPTLLSENAARMISSISTVTRFSIRFSALVMELFFETAKHSALASMGLSRRALITAITAARQQHFTSEERSLITNGDQDYASVMDKCTNLGIYVVHHTFTLAELFAMSGFHFFSNSMKNGLWVCHIFIHSLNYIRLLKSRFVF